MEQPEKDMVVADVNALRNQEVRVSVLQQLLDEQTAKLRQMEAVFCDEYDLDLEKYRAGKYQYDVSTGNFSERDQ